MATTGTKQAERALCRSSRSWLCAAGWSICQLRCPALCKDLCESEDKERYIPDTSELRSERLYFRIERLCGCISGTIVKVGFNGKSRMVCLSIGTAVYMDMTACRPENPQKALLCSPPVRSFAGEEHIKLVFT